VNNHRIARTIYLIYIYIDDNLGSLLSIAELIELLDEIIFIIFEKNLFQIFLIFYNYNLHVK
jgi:hypothetical protein